MRERQIKYKLIVAYHAIFIFAYYKLIQVSVYLLLRFISIRIGKV